MSTFFFDETESSLDTYRADEKVNKRVGAYNVSNTLLPIQPSNAPNPQDQYSYNKYLQETQYQPLPPPQIQDPQTGQPVIIGSRDFQVSLIGEDGPDEYLSVARAADRLSTVWEDAADIRYKLDQQYYQGGNYQPINFGIPKYTGDAGYPVVDPNPGQCKPGFLKDQFGRCLHMSWFNLPHSPAGNPWVDISGNSVITNGMNPINGVCPSDMFLASNGKCYFFPAPPQQYPPPPVSGVPVSGSSNYAGAYYGNLGGRVGNMKLFGRSPNGRVYNTPPKVSQALYGNNTVTVDYGGIGNVGEAANLGRINNVYVERQYLTPGDRAILHTNVTLLDQDGTYHLGIVVPDLNFKVATPSIPADYPGLSSEVESNFIVPVGTEQGDYIGEVQLVRNDKKIDSVNFVLSVD